MSARILLVEDNPMTRRMFRAALASQGWHVDDADCGAAALASYSKSRPDAVVMDLTLPDMEGSELAERIAALPDRRLAPLIAMSGFLSKLEEARGPGSRFVEQLFKPVDPDRLVQVVRANLQIHGPASPGYGHHVIVVDDDPLQARAIRTQLQAAGFAVRLAASGLEALSQARAEPPHALVSDVLMPEMDGFHLCLAIRADARLKDVPVVLTSVALSDEEDRALARRVGASDLVPRAGAVSAICDAVLRAIASHDAPAPVTDRIALDEAHTHRLIRQLERQVARKAELAGRLALHEAAMGVLSHIERASRLTGSELLGDLLYHALDAAGISVGCVFLREPDGTLRLAVHQGFSDAEPLAAFYGRADLLERAVDTPLSLPLEGNATDDLMSRAGAGSMMLLPLRFGGARVGVLVLAAARRRMSAEWLPLAEAIAAQIAQAITLARALEQIRGEQQRFRQLADSMPQIVWATDARGAATYSNQRWAEYTAGAPHADALGWRAVIHPEDAARVSDAWADHLARPRTFEIEARFRNGHTGDYRWHLTRAVPARDAGGAVQSWYGTSTDVHEQRIAADRLRQNEELLRTLTDNIESVLWMTDPLITQIHYVSPAYELIWGRSREGVLDDPRAWAEGVHPEDRARVLDEMLAAQQKGDAFLCSYRVVRPGGEVRFIRDRGFPVRDVAGAVSRYVGFATDISDLEQAGRTLRSTEEQLRRAQKMEAVGRLAGGVAHDFNNILAVIIGYTELACDELDERDPMRGQMDLVLKAANRAAGLTRQLLIFSRHERVVPQVIDVNAVVVDLEKMLHRLIGEDIELRVELDAGAGRTRVDKGYLEQVVLNLAVNARDAMPRGGVLRIATAAADARGAPHVAITIGDTGCGMSADVLSHLFEPFFTTKDAGRGTGLGLSTVYGIVEGAGGHVEVDSREGEGSTFRVLLPRVDEEATVSVGPERNAGPIRGTETILLVEDDDLLRAMAEGALRKAGFHVLSCANGGEALLVCEQHAGSIELLVTDVIMPRMSGPELATRLRVLRKDLRILFCSGYTSGSLEYNAALASGQAFLQKPFGPQALLRRVRDILDADP